MWQLYTRTILYLSIAGALWSQCGGKLGPCTHWTLGRMHHAHAHPKASKLPPDTRHPRGWLRLRLWLGGVGIGLLRLQQHRLRVTAHVGGVLVVFGICEAVIRPLLTQTRCVASRAAVAVLSTFLCDVVQGRRLATAPAALATARAEHDARSSVVRPSRCERHRVRQLPAADDTDEQHEDD